jgi:hypothetical protein
VKLNAKTRVGESGPKDHGLEMLLSDKSVSKAELYRSLQERKNPMIQKNSSFISVLVGKTTTWMSAKLWNKIAVGYEDEQGFHYGSNPADTEAHGGH